MKDDKRPGDDRPRRIRARGGRSEVVLAVPGTGISVIRDEATARVFLVASYDIRRKSARIYTNTDGLRLHESQEHEDTVLEHRGEELTDEGDTFVYTVTEYSLDDRGEVATKELRRQVIDVTLPVRDDAVGGFGYGVSLLVEDWVEPREA